MRPASYCSTIDTWSSSSITVSVNCVRVSGDGAAGNSELTVASITSLSAIIDLARVGAAIQARIVQQRETQVLADRPHEDPAVRDPLTGQQGSRPVTRPPATGRGDAAVIGPRRSGR